MFIYQTKKRELYYDRVIALYQQTGYGKKRLGKLFPEIESEKLPTDVQELQAELKRLRAQLTKAEIKAEAYDELINVAEAKFNIQIRKKAGAKQ